MNETFLEQSVFSFLTQYLDFAKPVLLGLSGGPDSLALLHLLLKCRHRKPFTLGIAHVDHGWRIESAQEAAALGKNASSHGLNFHLCRLTPSEMQGNLESACRDARLQFFAQLRRTYGYQAVILGHHADDQIETVLKRIFEGANLPYLRGLREITEMPDLPIWRPLLKYRKSVILNWINQHGLVPFEDKTNEDPRFLRGKMRTRILPLLSKEFGKQVGNSIERLSRDSQELQDYLDFKIESYLSKIEKCERGCFLDLSSGLPLHSFELKYLIKKFCEINAFFLSREGIENAAQLITSKIADKMIAMGTKIIQIDRGRLFIETFSPSSSQDFFQLELGTHQYGNWEVEVTPSIPPPGHRLTNWKDAWEGKCEAWLPKGDYHLGPVRMNANYPNNSPISRWWTETKVPAFLRSSAPLVWEGERIKTEFLSGKENSQGIGRKESIKISLKLTTTNM